MLEEAGAPPVVPSFLTHPQILLLNLNRASKVATFRRLSKCESLHSWFILFVIQLSSFTPESLYQCDNNWPVCSRCSCLFRGAFDYELTLRTDMYTEKHTQWFYFRLRNMKAKMIYRFTITNLMKASSLYSLGMRPLLYSERAAKENGVGWHRAGSNIKYYQNCSEVASGSAFRPLHVCKFCYMTWQQKIARIYRM